MAGQSILTSFPAGARLSTHGAERWATTSRRQLRSPKLTDNLYRPRKTWASSEGDLIRCLNAGDGSWWMGRLRRDRRMDWPCFHQLPSRSARREVPTSSHPPQCLAAHHRVAAPQKVKRASESPSKATKSSDTMMMDAIRGQHQRTDRSEEVLKYEDGKGPWIRQRSLHSASPLKRGVDIPVFLPRYRVAP